MKYNEKYDLYLDDDLVIYYWNKNKDKLMQRTISKDRCGYLRVSTKIGLKMVHRIIYETFVGPIPDGMEIDHINTIRTDNRLENLRCVTHKENDNNPLSRKHRSEACRISMIGNKHAKGHKHSEETRKKQSNKAKLRITSEFGRKFKEHYGISRYQNTKLYDVEYKWYYRHNYKCSWE